MTPDCEKFLAQVKADLHSEAEVSEAAVRIVRYVCGKPLGELKYLTWVTLSSEVKAKSENVASAIQYLCGARAQFLDTKFEFIDGDEIEEVDRESIADAKVRGYFEHPVSGERVEDYEKKIFLYFIPGTQAVLLKGGRR